MQAHLAELDELGYVSPPRPRRPIFPVGGLRECLRMLVVLVSEKHILHAAPSLILGPSSLARHAAVVRDALMHAHALTQQCCLAIAQTLFPGLLAPGVVAEAVALLKHSYAEVGSGIPGRGPEDHEPGALRTHNLTARGAAFREIVQTKEIITCMEHLLGGDCENDSALPQRRWHYPWR